MLKDKKELIIIGHLLKINYENKEKNTNCNMYNVDLV